MGTLLADSAISAVNVCEILTKLLNLGMSLPDARTAIELLGIPIVPFDAEAAHAAAAQAGHTRRLGLSLGDRACLALGLLMKSTVVTADQAWAKLDLGLKIEVIR